MARRIATIRGIALRPGVSKNRRLYTKENIGRAFERATARLAEDNARPLTMYTHHDGARDASRLVGRVTKLARESDGTLRFHGDIADTKHGRDIHALVDTEDGEQAFLDGVSIRGRWVGPVRTVRLPDGTTAETADDLEIDGIDFTSRPGVAGARIEATSAAGPGTSEAWSSEGLIFESADRVLLEASKTPYGDVAYADPGYLPDKKKRYPVDTERHARAAWSYINRADNAREYTANQLKRVKGRIKSALRKFGVKVTAETAPAPLVPLAEDAAWSPVAECAGDLGAGFSISARNGPISVNISAYDGIEPAELEVIAKAAMAAACDALRAMDPDMDADIDVPGAPGADADHDTGEAAARRPDDNQMEAAPAAAAPALTETAPAVRAGVTTTPPEVPAVSEPQTPAAAPATVTLTQEQFEQLLARTAPAAAAAAAAPAPAVATATETAPAATEVQETEEQRVARLVAEGMAAQRDQLLEALREQVRQDGPARRGLSPAPGGAATTPDGAAADPQATRRARNDALLAWVSNGRYSNEQD